MTLPRMVKSVANPSGVQTKAKTKQKDYHKQSNITNEKLTQTNVIQKDVNSVAFQDK